MRFWFFFCLIGLALNANAFKPRKSYVEGELIAQLKRIEDTAAIKQMVSFKLEFEVLSHESKIVKLSFNPFNISTDLALQQVLSIESDILVHIQKNHYTYLRSQTLPNDTLYSLQSNFWNILDAPEAWEKTTGGFTSQFDEIVIAVIDDGVDTAHPDLRRNLWINKHEVPYDGIDNDNNGYTDDYYGWNCYDDNGIVIEQGANGSHGTPVAGLIGADGNNITGLTGSNWKVNVMNVVGGSFTEVENIKAFTYVLNQKKAYLASNGTKGAYVVALNCSWGLDRQFPEDFPLWCSFYDTLGKYGITTFAATSNASRDIEKEGDMPSLCSSDYLVVVSNMSNVLGPRGGVGDTAVDIAAPGDLTNSLCPISYGVCSKMSSSFNGTSGATPLAAGLFGLIHSYACDSFVAYTKSNPAAASLLAKKWLMDGAEKRAAFNGSNVSGGSVNYNLALKELENWCQSIDQPVSNSRVETQINQLKIYPNPTQNNFTISTNSGLKKIQIYNLQSQLVHSQYCDGQNTLELNVGLNAGLYLIRVETEDGSIQMTKLQVQ